MTATLGMTYGGGSKNVHDRALLRSQPHPKKPRVLQIGPTEVELAWEMPAGDERPKGFSVSAQRGGASNAWQVVCNTGTAHCYVIVEGLQPSSWYQFRVAPVYATLGQGYGSAPSEPCKTLEANKRPVERRVVGRTREGAPPLATGQTAAAAMVVARGADTTPAPTEEESAQYAATVAHAVSMAKLRKEVLEWDVDFESAHGRAATNDERLGSKTRARTLGDYLVAKSLKLGAIHDLELSSVGVGDASGGGGAAAFGMLGAERLVPGGDAPHIRAAASGGVMGDEQRQLAARLAADARSLYIAAITERCASLAHHDELTPLSADAARPAIARDAVVCRLGEQLAHL